MKNFLTPLLFFSCFSIFSQNLIDGDIDAGADTTVDCTTTCVDLTATFTPTYDTTAGLYDVLSIPYDPQTLDSSAGITADDSFSEVIDLPFTFCYFGIPNDQIVIGGNGNISFDTALAGDFDPYTFTADCPDPALPSGGIFGAYQDIDPSVGGEITYGVTGTAPFRAFVIIYKDVPQYSCNANLVSTQIALHETSNFIDVYVGNKPECTSWNDGNSTIGIQNIGGTQGYAAPGRNTSDSPWSASNEGWRFAPSGVGSTPAFNFEWRDATGAFLSTDNPYTVCPTADTTYTVHVEYTDCVGNIQPGEDTVTVTVTNSATSVAIPDMEQCDLDLSGDEDFMLTDNDALQAAGSIISYHLSSADAIANTAPQASPFNLTTAVGTITIYCRIENPVDGCYLIEEFDLFAFEFPQAGVDNTLEFCEGDATLQNLFALLGATATTGGDWFDNDGAGVDLTDPTMVDFSAVPDGVYTFNYNFTAGVCPADDAVITITISNLLLAGTDGVLEFCETETTPQNLFAALTGTPDTGGIWTDLDITGVDLTDPTNVDFSAITDGVYNFKYEFLANGSCTASEANIEVTITNLASAGTAGFIEICEGETTLQDLVAALGTPDALGTWTDVDVSGVDLTDPTAVDFNTIADGVYNFEYSFDPAGSCPAVIENVEVTINNLLVAGLDGNIGFCETETTLQDLFAALNGTPDVGGTWADDDTSGVDLTDPSAVDFSTIADGTYHYTYSFPVNGQCPASDARITVTIDNLANAGITAAIEFCEGETALQNLFTSLGGTPDTGGLWSDDDTSGVDLTDPTAVDFSLIADGVYHYTYSFNPTVSCPLVSTTLTVTITNKADAGLGGVIEFCEGETGLQNLVIALTGTPDAGGIWVDTDLTGVDLTDPTNVDFSAISDGVYHFDYTFDPTGSCTLQASTIEVTINNVFSPGLPGTLDVCFSDFSPQSLFNALTGTPEPDGIWTDLDGTGVDMTDINNIDFSAVPVGSYEFEYMFPGVGSCPSVSSIVTVVIHPTPISLPAEDLVDCDEDNDGFGEFNLEDATFEITGGDMSLTVTYHETFEQADNGIGILTSPYHNNNPYNQIIYIRVYDATTGGCANVYETLNLLVINSPILPTEDVIFNLCDYDGTADGFTLFNLTDIEGELLAGVVGTPADYTVDYYLTEADAIAETSAIGTPTTFTNTTTPDQVIYAVVTSLIDGEGCTSIKEITLHVDLAPTAISQPFSECDNDYWEDMDEITTFDLVGFTDAITGGDTSVTVDFYTVEADAIAGVGPSLITTPEAYDNETPAVQNIYARVFNPTTGCFSVAIITLRVEPNPTPSKPEDLGVMELCDGDVDGDGLLEEQKAIFDLTIWEAMILQGDGPGPEPGVSLTYFENEDNALANVDAIASPDAYENATNSQTIYIRATNDVTGCTTITWFDIFVPVPQVTITGDDLLCVDGDGVPLAGVPLPALTANAGPGIVGDYTYEWQLDGVVIPGETNDTLVVNQAGEYTVTISSNTNTACINYNSFTVTASSGPIEFDADVTTLAFDDSHQIIATATGIGNYIFSLDGNDFVTSGTFDNVAPGLHTITIQDEAGCGTEILYVTIVDYMKFFTPNGDGYNDTWQITGQDEIPISQIYIFDRFGKLLKQLDPDTGWDGTYNGHVMPADDYWFKIIYIEGDSTPTQKEFKAHFALKR